MCNKFAYLSAYPHIKVIMQIVNKHRMTGSSSDNIKYTPHYKNIGFLEKFTSNLCLI